MLELSILLKANAVLLIYLHRILKKRIFKSDCIFKIKYQLRNLKSKDKNTGTTWIRL